VASCGCARVGVSWCARNSANQTIWPGNAIPHDFCPDLRETTADRVHSSPKSVSLTRNQFPLLPLSLSLSLSHCPSPLTTNLPTTRKLANKFFNLETSRGRAPSKRIPPPHPPPEY
jgi:hypothetical protein